MSWLRGLRPAALALLLLAPGRPAAAADWQIRPFIAVTFGGRTTLVDLENAADKHHAMIGVTTAILGDIIGVDVDLAHGPGFFESGNRHLVLQSSVTTLMGNIVVAAPRHLTEYTLRPYLVGGLGLMRVDVLDDFDVLPIADSFLAYDIGGGAIGFVTNRVGVCWDVRRFRNVVRSGQTRGVSVDTERLSYWRASMALAIRY
jgi:hypothetical protein